MYILRLRCLFCPGNGDGGSIPAYIHAGRYTYRVSYFPIRKYYQDIVAFFPVYKDVGIPY